MKKITLVCISLSCFLISASCIDVLLSWFAYIDRPAYFIENEANREIVGTFVNGNIPYGFIISLFFAVIVVILFMIPKFYDKPKYKKVSKLMMLGFIYASFAHVLGGLTWYYEMFYPFVFGLQLATVCLVIFTAYELIEIFSKFSKEKKTIKLKKT